MLTVRDLAKQYPLNGRPRTLFRDLSFDLKLLGGVIEPSAGSIRWNMSCSWPLGFGGGFQGGMTGVDNIRFIARVYRRSITGLIDQVDKFAELGDALMMPLKHYSTGMRARLAFGLSIAIEFDCYLIDEITAVGDASFTQRCEEELFGKRAQRAFVIATHDLDFMRTHCTRAVVIDNGRAKVFDNVDLAIEVYTAVWEEHHAPSVLIERAAPIHG
jgi:capsular polysaccharide transport system ATP-binding protein